MKTAEEWIKTGPILYPTSGEFVKAIQLDAMKEGMRRAAKLDNVTPIKDGDGEVRYRWSEYGEAIIHYEKAILSAAEKLTEKDL